MKNESSIQGFIIQVINSFVHGIDELSTGINNISDFMVIFNMVEVKISTKKNTIIHSTVY